MRMLFWLKKMLRNPKGIGSIAPSSSQLAEKMTTNLPAYGKILEIGPGIGSITTEILKHISPVQLELIEMDEELARICQEKFPNVRVYTGDAEKILSAGSVQYDVIISGVPFGAMNSEKRKRFFKIIHEHLAPNGKFILFQYTFVAKDELKKEFGSVHTSFTPWNIPPAFVYTTSKKSELQS